MREKKLRGVFTAIVTPFDREGDIAWPALERLVERQVEAGVAGIVPCGTTGESPTLEEDEALEVITKVVKWVGKRCLVIAGTGSNNTAHAVSLSRQAESAGADGCLVVNPYYNKPTQEGLYRHFRTVAQAVSIPIMLYNIRGRTAVNVETATLLRIIHECPNLVAVKEASGDLDQIGEVIKSVPDHVSILSGDDNITLKTIEMGADGVVSVASNIIPHEMRTLVDCALRGDLNKAREVHERYMPLFEAIFYETNPIPVKAALSMQGLCEEVYRLPLCEMSIENRKRLGQVLKQLELV